MWTNDKAAAEQENGSAREMSTRDTIVAVVALIVIAIFPLIAPVVVVRGILALRKPVVASRMRAFAWAGIVIGLLCGGPAYYYLVFRLLSVGSS